MDKNAIKKFAVWARTELISRVTQKAEQYEISAEADPNVDSVHGVVLSVQEKKQRSALISQVREKGKDQVMEEVAYTWFNRFCALRFMEVNNYLPSRIRVFTDEDNNFKPQILTEAIHLDLEGLDMEKVYVLKESNDDETLYRYLLITQCNALSGVLPGMFQKIADETELLFPDNLLREGSVIEQMISLIPEDNWDIHARDENGNEQGQVQIIGWLYQYYNSEKKQQVFDGLKKNKKVTKENIPATTQLFTPDWIVHYMVENSLGRLWLDGHPDSTLKSGWKYYLDEAEQEPEVEAQLAEIRKDATKLKPEDIKVIDPCAGSGHICIVMFDILMQIYTEYGYSSREAVRSILENNLYGLDIDDRAAQLAYFSVMMKAVQYDLRFLRRSDIPQPHIYAIAESNHISEDGLNYFCGEDPKLKSAMETIRKELYDAKEYGSILTTTEQDWGYLYARFDEIENEISMYRDEAMELKPLVQTAETLSRKYDVVCTNPPYSALSNLDAVVNKFVKESYPDSKSDLFAVFIERCGQFTKVNRYQAMITQHAWMFLSSYEKLRRKLLQKDTINMAHLGSRAFEEIGGEVVQTSSFVMRNRHIGDYRGIYCRLLGPTTQDGKEEMFLSGENRYIAQQDNFAKIPGSPVAYWVSKNCIATYNNPLLEDIGTARSGLQTGDNDKYLRYWQEVSIYNIAFHMRSKEEYLRTGKRWVPQIKGGAYRKWYGNFDYVVNWENDGAEIRSCPGCRLNAMGNEEFYFVSGITWSHTTSIVFGARYLPNGYLFNVEAPTYFVCKEKEKYILALLNTCVIQYLLDASNATMHYLVGNIIKLPYVYDAKKANDITKITDDNISISSVDWDSFETSWDFQKHPMIKAFSSIEKAYVVWKQECGTRFFTLKDNEEELNRIFIDIYGLQEELPPEETDKDVTVHRIFDAKEDIPESMTGSSYALTKQDVIKSLISYAVGCMFGRYSLDEDGLIYAGGDWDASRYKTFPADKDGILPICDDEYFEDDIVGRFVDFIRTVYGADTLEENLRFIADALGGKGSSREVIRNYFLNDFYKDHCKTYQKRPIYWLFDSGKKNGFKCLIYMHRYKPDTIARIRTDYLHEQQSRYRTAIADLEHRIQDASTADRVRLNKKLTKLQAQAEEARVYEEKIHHLADQMISIDLDDGVKHNYAIFQDVLAKIK